MSDAAEVFKNLKVELDLDEDDIVVEAMVIAKVVRRSDFGSNLSAVVIGTSDTMDYITQLGLLEACKFIIPQGEED